MFFPQIQVLRFIGTYIRIGVGLDFALCWILNLNQQQTELSRNNGLRKSLSVKLIDFTLRGWPLFVTLRVVVSIIGCLLVEMHIADTWHAIRRRNCLVSGVPPCETDIPLLTLGTSWVSFLKRFTSFLGMKNKRDFIYNRQV